MTYYTHPHELISKALEAPNPLETIWSLATEGEIEMADIGNFVADHPDGIYCHPWLSEGVAYIDVGGGLALVAEWTDDGFWNVYEASIEDARLEVEEREALEAEGEED